MDLSRRFLLPLLFIPIAAFAWEVPSFDCANQKLEDSSKFFNDQVNQRLDTVIDLVNSSLSSCDKEKFIKELSIEIASSWFGNLETWAMTAPVDKCDVTLGRSTYRDMGWLDSPVLNTVGLHPVINIGGHHIGVDKLAHFMSEGLEYYKAEIKGASLNEILSIGLKEEEGIMGLMTTGIKSYGDLSANYFGYQFWRNLVRGANPYVKCENNRWVRVRDFHWEDFVTDMMDETINCNSYRAESIEKAVQIRTAQLYSNTHSPLNYACPVRQNQCAKLYQHLNNSKVASAIMHPRCLHEAEAQLKIDHYTQALSDQ